MIVLPIKTGLIEINSDLINILVNTINDNGIKIETNDIIAISAKVLSICRGYLIYYYDIRPSKEAIKLSNETGLDPRFVEAVIKEADKIISHDYNGIITIKDDILVINAGLDRKNVPVGYACRWPDYPDDEAMWIKREVDERFGVDSGIIIVDSKVMPMRRGTVGFALGSAGLNQSIDLRGRYDLYGKELLVTWMNVVDDLASTAHLLMRETTEMIPFVIIKDAPEDVYRRSLKSGAVKIILDECIYMRNLLKR
jgi:coenzyme F420-0:L-glutamate ligase/coenzyme F420-1:gamma-L-glutamate ligase